jgi:hypothetical protein
MLPNLSFNKYSEIYTLTLLREGKEIIHKFNAFVFGKADTFAETDVPDPKFTYYIWATYDTEDMMLWITNEEFKSIKSQKKEISEKLANYRQSKRQIRAYLATKNE